MIGIIVHTKRKYDKLVNDNKFSCMAYAWRKKNRHKKTFAARCFPIDVVTVGKHTYGMLDVRSFCTEAGEKLQIGNYVSIADAVTLEELEQCSGTMLVSLAARFGITRLIDNATITVQDTNG